MCDILMVAGLVGIILVVVPFAFYIYERYQSKPVAWCLHKMFLLAVALFICIALAWPALVGIAQSVCS